MKKLAWFATGFVTALLSSTVICTIWGRINPESFDETLDVFKP